MTIVITIAIAIVVFAVAAIALSIKVIAGNRTPLKEHACDVMCRHGKGHPCTCTDDGSCSDFPRPR